MITALLNTRNARLLILCATAIITTSTEAQTGKRTQGATKAKSKTTTSQEPLTLSMTDLYGNKTELLAKAGELSTQDEVMRNTADYVVRYRELQRGLQLVQPPLSDWSADEQSKVRAVPAPTAEGVRRLEEQQKIAADKVEQRVTAAQEDFERKKQENIKQAEREQQAKEAQLRAEQKQAEIDAYNRRTEDLDGYYYPYRINYPIYVPPRPRPMPR
jgi:hypothetical protein